MVFSPKAQHQECLKKCFDQCEKYGISILAAKSQFVVPCGCLVGQLVSKEGIKFDQDKVAIMIRLEISKHMTAFQGFLGACGYCRRFIYILC